MSIAWKRRAGGFLVAMALVAAIGFRYMPQGRLWNARLLPFWYLVPLPARPPSAWPSSGRTHRRALRRGRPGRSPGAPVTAATAIVGSLVVIIALAMPLRAMPNSVGLGPASVELGGTRADGSYHWLFLSTKDSSFVPVVGPLELHRLRGQARLPRVPRHRADDGRPRRAPTAAAGPCGSTRSSTTATARRWR